MPTATATVTDDGLTLPDAGSVPSGSGQSTSSFAPASADDVDGLETAFSATPPTPAYVSGLGAIKWALGSGETIRVRPLGVPAPYPAPGGRAVYRFRAIISDLTKAFSVGLMSGTPSTSLVANGVFAWWNGTALKLASAVGAASTANYTTAGSAVVPPGVFDITLDVQGGVSGHNVVLYCNGVFVGSLWNLTLPSGLFPCLCGIGTADISLLMVSSQVVA